jgi:hypothetical protein
MFIRQTLLFLTCMTLLTLPATPVLAAETAVRTNQCVLTQTLVNGTVEVLRGTIVQTADFEGNKYLAIVVDRPYCWEANVPDKDLVRIIAVSDGSENVDPGKIHITEKWLGHYVDLTVIDDGADGMSLQRIVDVK